MYTWILQWAPALMEACSPSETAETPSVFCPTPFPFGLLFACFMSACMIGSSLFEVATRRISQVDNGTGEKDPLHALLGTVCMSAGVSMFLSRSFVHSPLVLVATFIVFEMCVGFYFPAISSMRSKAVPPEHSTTIMNVFRLPLNILVVCVFLSIEQLGASGALGVSGLFLITASLLQRVA